MTPTRAAAATGAKPVTTRIAAARRIAAPTVRTMRGKECTLHEFIDHGMTTTACGHPFVTRNRDLFPGSPRSSSEGLTRHFAVPKGREPLIAHAREYPVPPHGRQRGSTSCPDSESNGQCSEIHRASPGTITCCREMATEEPLGRRSGPRRAIRKTSRRGVSTTTRSANPRSMRAPPTTPSHQVTPPRPVKAKDPELAVTGSDVPGLEDPALAFVAAPAVELPATAVVTESWLVDAEAATVVAGTSVVAVGSELVVGASPVELGPVPVVPEPEAEPEPDPEAEPDPDPDPIPSRWRRSSSASTWRAAGTRAGYPLCLPPGRRAREARTRCWWRRAMSR